MATVKDRVLALCQERGITINKLQKDTGIGNIVSRWDIYNPRADKLQAVAEYFNVPIEVLTGKQNIDDYIPTEKTSMVITDSQEIDVITMLRKLDTVNRYFICGKIAELLRDQEKEKEADKSSAFVG